jgi:uncharacterized protein (TIGR02996 family)
VTAALFEAVYDKPDEDAPREALAAALEKRKDPRGEFIRIQLAEARGTAKPDEVKHANALLKKHRDEWVAPFSDSDNQGYGIHRERWERGFPVHGFATIFYPNGPRAWRTVRSLVVDMDTRYHLLRGPLLEDLRALTWDRWYAGHYGTFCREARLPKLESLRWCGPHQHGSESFIRGLEKLSKFKHLTTLGFDPALVASEPAFWNSKTMQRIVHLELARDIEDAGGCVELGEPLPRLETLTFTDKPRSDKDPEATFALTIRRAPDHTLSIAEVNALRTPIDRAALDVFLSQLGKKVTLTSVLAE